MTRLFHRPMTVTALSCAFAALPLLGQEPRSREPARVLVLGTYHFANPGLDVIKTEVADVLSAPKQAKIESVVEALARFRPTKIAVERLPDTAARLQESYQAYRAGEHELTRDETQQLGFRLAAQFEHPRLHPIDYRNGFPFDAVMEYAQAHDPAFVAFVKEELAKIAEESNRRQREDSIGQILRWYNDPKELAEGHGTYMRFSRVGAGDTNVGADLVAKWYERNIHIFANVQGLAASGERILVIIGAGHAPILRELITADPEMDLVETLEYLMPAANGTIDDRDGRS